MGLIMLWTKLTEKGLKSCLIYNEKRKSMSGAEREISCSRGTSFYRSKD